MSLTTVLAAIAVFSVVAIASARTPRKGEPPRQGRRLLKWLGTIFGSAALVGLALQKLIPALVYWYGGEAFEWAILLGTLIGGLALVVAIAGALNRGAPRREIALLIAQLLGVWVVFIGALMQIRG